MTMKHRAHPSPIKTTNRQKKTTIAAATLAVTTLAALTGAGAYALWDDTETTAATMTLPYATSSLTVGAGTAPLPLITDAGDITPGGATQPLMDTPDWLATADTQWGSKAFTIQSVTTGRIGIHDARITLTGINYQDDTHTWAIPGALTELPGAETWLFKDVTPGNCAALQGDTDTSAQARANTPQATPGDLTHSIYTADTSDSRQFCLIVHIPRPRHDDSPHENTMTATGDTRTNGQVTGKATYQTTIKGWTQSHAEQAKQQPTLTINGSVGKLTPANK